MEMAALQGGQSNFQFVRCRAGYLNKLRLNSVVPLRQAKTFTQFNEFLRPEAGEKGNQMKTDKIIKVLGGLCACVALATTSTAFAQAPTVYHPGDLITFIVSFDGAGTNQIGAVFVTMQLSTPQRDDQPSFSDRIEATTMKDLGGGKFEVTTKIPEYAASGTYALGGVSAGPARLGGVWQYPPPTGRPPITITVDDDKHFAKPTLKGVEKTSHP